MRFNPLLEELSVTIVSCQAGLLLDERLSWLEVGRTRVKIRASTGHNVANIGLAGSQDASMFHLVLALSCGCSIRTSLVEAWSSLDRFHWDQSVTKA